MTDGQWSWSRTVAVHVDGTAVPDLDERGRPELDDLLIAIDGWREEVAVPAIGRPARWMREFDTYGPSPVWTAAAGETSRRPRSVVVPRAPR
jgi:hypothetical protein